MGADTAAATMATERSRSVVSGLEADAAAAQSAYSDALGAFERAVVTGDGVPAATKKLRSAKDALAGAEELLAAGRMARENAEAALKDVQRRVDTEALVSKITAAARSAAETEGRLVESLRALEDDLNRHFYLRRAVADATEELRERFGHGVVETLRDPLLWPLKDELRVRVDAARFGADAITPEIRENVAVSLRIFATPPASWPAAPAGAGARGAA